MKRWWARRRKTVLVVIGSLAVLIVGSLLLKWIGLDANAFAAVASALAAIAAFASARESSDTARQAIRALAWATKPVLRVRLFNYQQGDQPTLIIENISMYPVARATVRWKMRDGSRGQREIPGIEALKGPFDVGNETRLALNDRVQLPQLYGTDGTDLVTIDYWGPNGPVGWRITWRGEWTFHSDGQIASMGVSLGIVSDEEL